MSLCKIVKKSVSLFILKKMQLDDTKEIAKRTKIFTCIAIYKYFNTLGAHQV